MLRPTLVIFTGLTLITGVAYPLIATGICKGLFPRQAGGSLIEQDGKVVGSSLIGQYFDDPKYFWPRPSATSPVPYTAFNAEKLTGSSGSNQGPTNPALIQAVEGRVRALREADPGNTGLIPVDLVTASGSGLDPHISLAAAEFQAARVARARSLTIDQVRTSIAAHTQGRQFGVLGEPRVNVLELNLDLDRASNRPSR